MHLQSHPCRCWEFVVTFAMISFLPPNRCLHNIGWDLLWESTTISHTLAPPKPDPWTQVRSTDLNPSILFCRYVGCSGERILACPSSVFEGWLLHIGSKWRFPTRHAIPPRLQNIQTTPHNIFTRFAKWTRLVEVLTAQSELKATGPPLGLSGVVVSSLSILASATNKTINQWCTGYIYHSSQWATIWSLEWRFQMTLWVGPTNPPQM